MESAEFFIGTVSGALLLLTGVAVGWFIGRQTKGHASPESLDVQQTLQLLGGLSQWADNLVTDVSQHRELCANLSNRFNQLKQGDQPDESSGSVQLLTEMIRANEQLQVKLNDAETTLHAQAEKVAHSLNEARTDGLTKLLNRRALDDELRHQCDCSQKKGSTYSIGLIDVDSFKGLNDNHGHLAGDAILKRVSDILTQTADTGDVVTRFGGDEFAIVFPEGSPSPSEVVEQIRHRINTADFRFEEEQITLSVSCGWAEWQSGEDSGDVMRRADEALYAAKEDGRNVAYQHDGLQCRRITPRVEIGDSVAGSIATSNKLSQACDDLKARLLEVARDRSEQLQ